VFEDPLFLQFTLARKTNMKKERKIEEVVYSCWFAQFNLYILRVYNDHKNDITSRENEKV